MNNIDLSNQFDLMLNSYSQGRSILLTEYEKSVFLTLALDALIREYFNPTGIPNIDVSSVNEESLYKLISTINAPLVADSSTSFLLAYRINLTIDALCFLNEEALDSANLLYAVIPINHKLFSRLISKPYLYPNKREVWKLRTNETFLLIPPYNKKLTQYKARIVKNPNPIILEDLGDSRELNIKGKALYSECSLSDSLIPTLLRVATLIVLESKGLSLAQLNNNNREQQ